MSGAALAPLLRPTPVPVPPHVFALDGAAAALRPVRARPPAASGLRAYREAALPRDAFHAGLLGGPLRDPAAFQRAASAALVRGVPGGGHGGLAGAARRLAARDLHRDRRAAARRPSARDEVLRWKLRRLVPFRVDELRVGAAEVDAAARARRSRGGCSSASRVEQLLAQLEDGLRRRTACASARSPTPAWRCSPALEPGRGRRRSRRAGAGRGRGLHAGLRPRRRAGAPPLQGVHRRRCPRRARPSFVARDLKLTRNFLDEHFPGSPLGPVLLLAPPEAEPLWMDRLGEGLGEAARRRSTAGTCRRCAPRTRPCPPGATSRPCSAPPARRWHEHPGRHPRDLCPQPRAGRARVRGPASARRRPAPGRRSTGSSPLNLARRPFLNTRPVTRVALLLLCWVCCSCWATSSLFWSYLSGSAEKRAELEQGEQEVTAAAAGRRRSSRAPRRRSTWSSRTSRSSSSTARSRSGPSPGACSSTAWPR